MARRTVIIVDDPEDGGPLRCEATRIDFPTGPERDLFSSWEEERRPVLMARLEMPSLRALDGPPEQKAEALVRMHPEVDAWMLHHFNKTDVEATVAALRDRDRMVIRVLDMSNCRESGRGEPIGNWNRVRMDAIDRFDVGVRDSRGNFLHFRWFGRGVMMDWGKVYANPEAMGYLLAGQGFLLDPKQSAGFWQLDAIHPHVPQWALLEGVDAVEAGEYELPPGRAPITQEELNTLVNQDEYALGVEAFCTSFLSGDRRGYTNGDKGFDGLRMWEGTNVRGKDTFDDRLKLWREKFGNVLELRSPGTSDNQRVLEDAKKGIATWAVEGGFLWCDNRWYVGHPSYPLGETTPIHKLAVNARRKEM